VTVAWIVAIVFLVLGVLATAGAIMSYRKTRQSQGWPTVPGRITASELTTETRTEYDDENRRSRETIMYGVSVRYDYVVGGKSFHNDRLYWADGIKSNSDRAARATVAKYPAGAEVTVYVNPADPNQALLEPGTMKGVVLGGVFAAAFSGFGVIMAFVAMHPQ
jgi:hypothetical protein